MDMQGESLKLHHIGLATSNMEETKKYLSEFFRIVDVSDTVYDENQGAKLCMLTMDDGTLIELIEGDVVRNYIKKRNFMYHACYQTDNMERVMERFTKKGALLVSEPKEAVLFQNRKVAFLMTELGLIELLEG